MGCSKLTYRSLDSNRRTRLFLLVVLLSYARRTSRTREEEAVVTSYPPSAGKGREFSIKNVMS